MSITKSIFSLIIFAGVLTTVVSCSDDAPAPASIVATTINDLDADYAPFDFSTPPTSGPPQRVGETGKYTLFSFSTGEIVANTDSATAKWDIGFRATSIIINGGTSGLGEASAQVLHELFEDVSEAPESGYGSDDSPSFAIASHPLTPGTSASNQWWQNGGSGSSTIVSPIPGQVIVVKTSENRFAKMEILNYYKGAPASPNNMTDLDRYYTFRYVYQPNDSRTFE